MYDPEKHHRRSIRLKDHNYNMMPNHIHGILEITNCGTNHLGVARNAPTGNFMSDISPKHTALPTIIRAYKSAVSKQMHELGFVGQIWQRNYYEHIIRDEQSYQTQSQYIIDNPANWSEDKFYIEL